jgi:hypothetical protein
MSWSRVEVESVSDVAWPASLDRCQRGGCRTKWPSSVGNGKAREMPLGQLEPSVSRFAVGKSGNEGTPRRPCRPEVKDCVNRI